MPGITMEGKQDGISFCLLNRDTLLIKPLGPVRIFKCFWKSYNAHQGYIYVIKDTVILSNIITIENTCFMF